MPLPAVPDYVGIIRRASHDKQTRALASRHFAILMAEENPLGADHGNHHPRASDMGACSLAYVAENLGLMDLPRTDDSQWIMDTGTVMGAWLGCLLKAGATLVDGRKFFVHLEVVVAYDGVPGHVDVTIEWLDGSMEPIEFKSTASTSKLAAPDVRKLYQALQACFYGEAERSERFTLISYGYNVGDDKEGTPHPKMRQDTYPTKDYLPLVDAELARLRDLLSVERVTDDDGKLTEEAVALADGTFCGSCRFGKCLKNKNPMRYALV